MQNKFRTTSAFLLAVAGVGFCLSAQAASGPSLLSPAYQGQLESWLGEGRLALTNVYSKAAGDTSLDFHKASDGKGRTFSIMEATNTSGQTWLVGGYNPQSWSSTDGMHVTMDDSQRTVSCSIDGGLHAAAIEAVFQRRWHRQGSVLPIRQIMVPLLVLAMTCMCRRT